MQDVDINKYFDIGQEKIPKLYVRGELPPPAADSGAGQSGKPIVNGGDKMCRMAA